MNPSLFKSLKIRAYSLSLRFRQHSLQVLEQRCGTGAGPALALASHRPEEALVAWLASQSNSETTKDFRAIESWDSGGLSDFDDLVEESIDEVFALLSGRRSDPESL